MIALAKVVDKAKLDAFIGELNIPKYNDYAIQVLKLKDIPRRDLDDKYWCEYTERLRNSTLIKTTCLNDNFTIAIDSKGMGEDNDILVVIIINDEGDQDFYSTDCDEYGYPYLDHDIDIDFFPKWQQKVWEALDSPKSIGVEDIAREFGAGRNG
jgi:hypothetical protein